MAVTNVDTELSACYKDCEGLIRDVLERRMKTGLVPGNGSDVQIKYAKEDSAPKKNSKGRSRSQGEYVGCV